MYNLANENILPSYECQHTIRRYGNDMPVTAMNKRALESLSNGEVKELEIIHSVTDLFEQPGKIEKIAGDWFEYYLQKPLQ